MMDMALFEDSLKLDEKNSRNLFYLAKTYFEMEKYETAILLFQKHNKLDACIEEKWYSLYCQGKCYYRLQKIENALLCWINAYIMFPDRIENLYHIIKHYREREEYDLAYYYYELAIKVMKAIKAMNEDPKIFLFTEENIYKFDLYYEFTIFGFYCNPLCENLSELSMTVLSRTFLHNTVILLNYKFYSTELSCSCILKEKMNDKYTLLHDIATNIRKKNIYSTTPSITYGSDDKTIIHVSVRCVNYYIDDDSGMYVVPNDIVENEHILVTIFNKNNTWCIKDEEEEGSNKIINENDIYYDNCRYYGLEDMRIYLYNDTIVYNATRVVDDNAFHIEHGSIKTDNIECRNMQFLQLSNPVTTVKIQKNWILFDDGSNNLKCIHQWYPLSIGEINKEGKVINEKNHKCPLFFSLLRGSTNGVVVGNDVWFLCHVVSYEDRRYYYHIIVVLNKNTNDFVSCSAFFTFEGKKIEYTLGMIYLPEDDAFLIGYSTMDRNTKFMAIPKKDFIDRTIIKSSCRI